MTSQEIIETSPEPLGNMNKDRIKMAAGVFSNQEFKEYVVKTLDSLRTEVLMEGHPNLMSGELLSASLLTTRGKILALNEIYAFFNGCYNESEKKEDN